MIIGIYTDIHASFNSSIMPIHCDGSIYSTRLQMIIDTFKWMYSTFEKENVELIFNGGDLFDSNTIKSEEITAISEAYRYSKGVPEKHILGNHEITNNDKTFYSTALLGNFPFIEIYDKPTKLDNYNISLLPYMKSDDITSEVLSQISGDNQILISHIDIKGSSLRPSYIMEFGVNSELIANYFTTTLNGHLHTAEKVDTSRNSIYNIGSTTSLSFNDNSDYIPGVCIYNTETHKMKHINNPNAVLFRKFKISTLGELLKKLNDFDNTSYKYILRVTVPYDLREKARDAIELRKNVMTCRVISDMTNYHSSVEVKSTVDIKYDMREKFIEFLNSDECNLNYPLSEYLEVLSNLQ